MDEHVSLPETSTAEEHKDTAIANTDTAEMEDVTNQQDNVTDSRISIVQSQTPTEMDISSNSASDDEARTPPPPPPRVLLMPPPPPPMPVSSPPARPPVTTPTVRVISGLLTTAQRSSHRDSRWLVVVLDYENVLPFRLGGPSAVLDVVSVWRPRKASTFAESYTSFFPTSSELHAALLDPRSGERLHVWGEPSTEDGKAPKFEWDDVVKYLETFITLHSIEGVELGPLHHRDKPWAVSTRRESPALDSLPPTSAMDDEEAAIAAAIAASLAESKKMDEDEDEYEMDEDDDDFEMEEAAQDDDDEEGYEDSTGNDESTDQTSSGADSEPSVSSRPLPVAVPIPRSWSDVASASTPVSFPGLPVNGGSDSDDEDRNGTTPSIAIPGSRPTLRDASRRMSMSPGLLTRTTMPARSPALSRTPEFPPSTYGPSSVESVASSYLERAHSRHRSAHDPSLLESRALRMEQDAELAASLEEDRRKERMKREAEEKERKAKQDMEDARNRLPPEPKTGVSIALRMPDGSRVARKFSPNDKLSSVADLCLAHSGVRIIEGKPNEVLWNKGSLKPNAVWTAEIGEVCTDTRVMLIVHQ